VESFHKPGRGIYGSESGFITVDKELVASCICHREAARKLEVSAEPSAKISISALTRTHSDHCHAVDFCTRIEELRPFFVERRRNSRGGTWRTGPVRQRRRCRGHGERSFTKYGSRNSVCATW